MKYSAQAIIVDRNEKIYLERNKKIDSLSLVGGKLEEGENYEIALLREIKEELGLSLTVSRLLDGEEQSKRVFSTGEWISKYFVVVLEDLEEKIVGENNDIEVYQFQELERMEDDEFPFERVTFLQQIQRALDAI